MRGAAECSFTGILESLFTEPVSAPLPSYLVWPGLGAWDLLDRSALEPATDAVAAIPALERRDAAPVPPVHHPVPPDVSDSVFDKNRNRLS